MSLRGQDFSRVPAHHTLIVFVMSDVQRSMDRGQPDVNHNSDSSSLEAARHAIDKYLVERNEQFLNPFLQAPRKRDEAQAGR